MKSVAATAAKNRLGALLTEAQREPVAIERHGLVSEVAQRRRAEEALAGCVGNVESVRTSLALAREDVRRARRRAKAPAAC
jgi:hypothetical protein